MISFRINEGLEENLHLSDGLQPQLAPLDRKEKPQHQATIRVTQIIRPVHQPNCKCAIREGKVASHHSLSLGNKAQGIPEDIDNNGERLSRHMISLH